MAMHTTTTTGVKAGGNITGNITIDWSTKNFLPAPAEDKPLGNVCFNVQKPIQTFTGREQFLEDLHREIKESREATCDLARKPVRVISSTGGVGKTETVRMYIQEALRASVYQHVIWFDAELNTVLENQIRELASEIKVPIIDSIDDQGQDTSRQASSIVGDVYTKLCENQGSLLVVFDNADALHDDPTNGVKGIAAFLPQASHPNDLDPVVLVTSRNRSWRLQKVIELDLWTKDESVYFILSRVGVEGREENEGMAEVLEARGRRREALEIYNSILQRYRDAGIKSTRDVVAVRINVVRCSLALGDYVAARELIQRDQSILCLLLSQDTEEHSICILEYSHVCADAIMSWDDFQASFFSYNDLMHRRRRFFGGNFDIQAFAIARKVAHCLCKLGDYDFAHQVYSDILKLLKDKLPPSSLFILQIRNGLANALIHLGQTESAMEMLKDVEQVREKLLGPEHPDTLETKSSIASALQAQGKFQEALKAHKQVLRSLELILFPRHSDILFTKFNMGLIFFHQGNFFKAFRIATDVIQLKRTRLAGSHGKWQAYFDDVTQLLYNSWNKLFTSGLDDPENHHIRVYQLEQAVGLDPDSAKLVLQAADWNFETAQRLLHQNVFGKNNWFRIGGEVVVRIPVSQRMKDTMDRDVLAKLTGNFASTKRMLLRLGSPPKRHSTPSPRQSMGLSCLEDLMEHRDALQKMSIDPRDPATTPQDLVEYFGGKTGVPPNVAQFYLEASAWNMKDALDSWDCEKEREYSVERHGEFELMVWANGVKSKDDGRDVEDAVRRGGLELAESQEVEARSSGVHAAAWSNNDNSNPDPAEHSKLLQELTKITNVSRDEAYRLLVESNWDLKVALINFGVKYTSRTSPEKMSENIREFVNVTRATDSAAKIFLMIFKGDLAVAIEEWFEAVKDVDEALTPSDKERAAVLILHQSSRLRSATARGHSSVERGATAQQNEMRIVEEAGGAESEVTLSSREVRQHGGVPPQQFDPRKLCPRGKWTMASKTAIGRLRKLLTTSAVYLCAARVLTFEPFLRPLWPFFSLTPSSLAFLSRPACRPAASPQGRVSRETTQVVVQCADGNRLRGQFHDTQTVGDLYNFVNTRRPDLAQVVYVLTYRENIYLRNKAVTLREADVQRALLKVKLI